MTWGQLETGWRWLCLCPSRFQLYTGRSQEAARGLCPRLRSLRCFCSVHVGFFPRCIFIFGSGNDLRYFTRTEIQAQFGWISDKRKTGPQSRVELWLISTQQSPQRKGWGAEISAGYQACECGLVYGYYVRRPIGSPDITGFSKKP